MYNTYLYCIMYNTYLYYYNTISNYICIYNSYIYIYTVYKYIYIYSLYILCSAWCECDTRVERMGRRGVSKVMMVAGCTDGFLGVGGVVHTWGSAVVLCYGIWWDVTGCYGMCYGTLRDVTGRYGTLQDVTGSGQYEELIVLCIIRIRIVLCINTYYVLSYPGMYVWGGECMCVC